MPTDQVPGRRTAAGDAFSALVVEVLRAADLIRAAGDELARPDGLTSAQWRVMAVLEVAPVTVAQAARALGLARQSVQRVADTIVTAGLAAYVDNPADRRAHLAQLTEAGAAALRSIQGRQVAWADACAVGVSATDLQATRTFLATLAERVGAA